MVNKLPRRNRTGYQSENYNRPKGRGIKPSSAVGGLNLLAQLNSLEKTACPMKFMLMKDEVYFIGAQRI